MGGELTNEEEALIDDYKYHPGTASMVIDDSKVERDGKLELTPDKTIEEDTFHEVDSKLDS